MSKKRIYDFTSPRGCSINKLSIVYNFFLGFRCELCVMLLLVLELGTCNLNVNVYIFHGFARTLGLFMLCDVLIAYIFFFVETSEA